jgi:hypothetical protein
LPLHFLDFYTFTHSDVLIAPDPLFPFDRDIRDRDAILFTGNPSRIILIAPKIPMETGIAISPVARQSKPTFSITVHGQHPWRRALAMTERASASRL